MEVHVVYKHDPPPVEENQKTCRETTETLILVFSFDLTTT